MKRRNFIKNTFAYGAMGMMGGLYTWQVEPFWLEFVHRKMNVPNLPESLVGKTLMQISDIHVGHRFDYKYIIDSFLKAKKIEPDFVAYTGDFVSYENDEQKSQLQKVLKHAPQGRIGTFGILGNHDYGHRWAQNDVADDISQILSDAGLLVLRNAQVEIDGLNFIGLDDYWGTNFNPDLIMNQHSKEVANVVLCHNPDVCDLDVWNDYQGWILSGHTHGGQCKPPFLPPPILPVENKEYTSGAFDLGDGRSLYINRALGHLHQVRFNVRPEITVFHLDSKL